MISISRLLCGTVSPGDGLRYRTGGGAVSSPDGRPVVVWNCTRRCNLHCVHCYSDSEGRLYGDELSSEEGRRFLRDLAEFGVPVVLFSGGEPLFRKDIFEMASFAREQGLRIALSTNGTLISEDMAQRIARTGFAEVGISVDGLGEMNDRFRGQPGAFEAALRGIRYCLQAGQRVSLRFTLTGYNYRDVPLIFDLVEREGIPRVCFYHLAYSGRGQGLAEEDISHEETRAVLDLIMERTRQLHHGGEAREILTVGNHADGIYLYLKLKESQPRRAAEVWELLQSNGGNNSGVRIGAVDNLGEVHADQFSWHRSFGNVRQRKFGDIWLDTSDPIMRGLKDRKALLKGRCPSCRFLTVCNGNLRVRAEAMQGDVWAEDPACYLTDEEIGLAGGKEAA
ncbi:MAG: radical SAM protein [Dehalococcoidia bacterium]|nr:radical SAM protein [Dehalococcoidia bacterium]